MIDKTGNEAEIEAKNRTQTNLLLIEGDPDKVNSSIDSGDYEKGQQQSQTRKYKVCDLLNPITTIQTGNNLTFDDGEEESPSLEIDATNGLLRGNGEPETSSSDNTLGSNTSTTLTTATVATQQYQKLPPIHTIFAKAAQSHSNNVIHGMNMSMNMNFFDPSRLNNRGWDSSQQQSSRDLLLSVSPRQQQKKRKPSSSESTDMVSMTILPSGTPPDITKQFRKCSNCQTQATPSWRRCGPGDMLLCNACGLYFAEHGRHRPFRTSQDGRTQALRIRIGKSGRRKARHCRQCRKWLKEEETLDVCSNCVIYRQIGGN